MHHPTPALYTTLLSALFATLLTACGGGGGGGGGAVNITPDEAAFLAAFKDYSIGNYSGAIAELRSFETTFASGSPRLDDAQFYLGRSIHKQAVANLGLATSPAETSAALLALGQARTEYRLLSTNFPGSTWIDNADYQIAKTYFDGANFASAETSFNTFVTTHTNSTRMDEARYYLGRSIHEQAKAAMALAITPADTAAALGRLAAARTQYDRVVANFPSSPLADDAAYRSAKTWYHGADYPSAETKLAAFVAGYPVSTRQDDAHYYLARSIHRQAAGDVDLATTVAQMDAALLRLADARIEYAKVAVANPLSSLIDNAAYQSAVTRFDGADYATAIIELNTFITAYQAPPSTLLDDATYQLARSIHEQAAAQLKLAQTQPEIDAALLRFADARAAYTQFPLAFPLSPRIDDAAFYNARSHYDEANYATAITGLNAFILNPTYTASTRLDDAHYYLGRSIQGEASDLLNLAQTPLAVSAAMTRFADARVEYDLVVTTFPNGSLADDAAYRSAKTWYDSADYAMAITEFNTFLLDPTYTASSRLDNARYYRARSFHEQAIKWLAAAVTPTQTNTALAGFQAARDEYAKIPLDFLNSTLEDDAAYRSAMTYYDSADYLMAITHLSGFITTWTAVNSSRLDEAHYYLARSRHTSGLFAIAENSYRTLITTFPTSIYADNSQYYLALTFHDRNNCVTEKTEMQTVIDTYPGSFYAPLAQGHIDDINLLIGSTHVCI